jgi:poly-gamma-glutamate synthase PgsB/CapB
VNIPFSIYAILALLLVFLIFYRIEKVNHQKNIKSIPIRIWVNGSRGKSSVTRLIAAGLRAGGRNVIAKTTGTTPRLIIDNKLEQPLTRLGMANISEQIKVLSKAVKVKPDALVVECMALRPDLQKTESAIINPTIVVVTNVRPDHMDIMGPTLHDIARIFINAIPRNCEVFTTESQIFEKFKKISGKKNVIFHTSNTEVVSDDSVKKFPYIEHKENIALALDVCTHFGVDSKKALKGMLNATPDPGVLRKYEITLDNKRITIIDAMAANDPISTYLIWQKVEKEFSRINILINCREDRIDRSYQFAELLNKHLKADNYFLTGSGTKALARKIDKVTTRGRIYNLGGRKSEQVVDEVSKHIADKSLIFAIGNVVGYGKKMIDEFLKYRRT